MLSILKPTLALLCFSNPDDNSLATKILFRCKLLCQISYNNGLLADRFGTTDPRGISIALNISHEVLGGIVGASRQQVTEYLNSFDREKIIFREGRRIIVNIERLGKIMERAA